MKNNSFYICCHATSKFLPCLNSALEVGLRFHRINTLYKRNQQNCFPWLAWLIKSEAILIMSRGVPKDQNISPLLHDTYLLDYPGGGLENIGKHPAAKQISFIQEYLIRLCAKGNLILDLFGGSGSTLIACEQTDRICYMMEIEPKYCQVIINRWEAYTEQKATLIND